MHGMAGTQTEELTTLEKIKFSREAGAVRRCHSQMILGHYDVAQHTFNLLCMLRILYPEAPREVIWQALAHDVPERLTGDIPATTKWAGLVKTEELDRLEIQIQNMVGMDYHDLDPYWRGVVKGLDLLELYMWCRDQTHMGNRNMERMAFRIMQWFDKNGKTIPRPVWDVYMKASTSDWFYSKDLGD